MVRDGRTGRAATAAAGVTTSSGSNSVQAGTFTIGPFQIGPGAAPPKPLTGSPGFHVDPTIFQPVDPGDCENFSNSPLCGGDPPGFPPFPWMQPAGIEISSVGSNGCMTWVCLSGKLFGNATPDFCFYSTNGACPPPEPPPPQIRPNLEREDPIPLPNKSGIGWISKCKYFLYLKNPFESPKVPHGDYYGRFHRMHQHGLDLEVNDYIIPVYGPIKGLEFRYAFTNFDGKKWFNVFVVSGGLGQYPWDFTNPNTPRISLTKWHFVEFVNSCYTPRPAFLVPRPAFVNYPHEELWYWNWGIRPNFSGQISFFGSEVVPRYIATLPETWILDIQPAHKIEPYEYPDGTLAEWGFDCGPPPIEYAPPPQPRRKMCNCCSCSQIKKIIDQKMKPIYKILGFEPAEEPKLSLTPGTVIAALAADSYDTNFEAKEIEVKNIQELIGSLIGVNFYKAGYLRFPAKLPQTLLAFTDSSEQAELHNFADLFVWYIKQFDALVGKFPIEIDVKDSDPTIPDDQPKSISLPNIAETLAELVGVSQVSATNSDVAINFLMRLAAETIAIKNAGLITQDYVRANASYLGYKGNSVSRDVPYAFNPDGIDDLESLLSETTKQIVGWKDDDKTTVADYLQKIMYVASILKQVHFRSSGQVNDLLNSINKMGNPEDPDDWYAWLEFLAAANDPNSIINKNAIPKPSVTTQAQPEPPQ